jgi:hypothetical protein
MRRSASASSGYSQPRAVFRCPGCGAAVSVPIRARSVGTAQLLHEDLCAWIASVEQGVPVAPVQVEVVDGEQA